MFGAHPTAGAVQEVAHAVALAQANPFAHAAVAGVPHAPLVQVLAWVSAAFAHDGPGHAVHAAPDAPQAAFVEPATHVVPLQHPPLQLTDVEHVVSQE